MFWFADKVPFERRIFDAKSGVFVPSDSSAVEFPEGGHLVRDFVFAEVCCDTVECDFGLGLVFVR